MLAPEFVEIANKLRLTSWTDKVGDLPREWYHLVMYDEPQSAKLVHFTIGIPCFADAKDLGYGTKWVPEVEAARAAKPWSTLMAHSVHAQPDRDRLKTAQARPPQFGQIRGT